MTTATAALQKQNGETQPREGTITRRVWDIADEISASEKRPALRKEVLARAEGEKLKTAMAATQYGRWTRFHGLTREKLKAVRQGLREAAKASAAAEAADNAE